MHYIFTVVPVLAPQYTRWAPNVQVMLTAPHTPTAPAKQLLDSASTNTKVGKLNFLHCYRSNQYLSDDGSNLICPDSTALTDKERNVVLDAHNTRRSSLAKGLEADGISAGAKAPQAKRMTKMVKFHLYFQRSNC